MTKKVEFVTPLQFLILHELKEKKGTGTDLAKRIGNRKGSLLTPGTIYPTLKELKKKRLISFRTEGREKTYQLTKAGENELKALYREFGRAFKGLRYKIRDHKKKR